MSRRQWACVVALVLASVILGNPEPLLAADQDLGTDLFTNTAPPDEGAGEPQLVDLPLSRYELDYHTDVGLTNLDAIGPAIAHALASMLWSVTALLVRGVIELFTWAFSLNLLTGSDETGGEGALAPVADAITSIYDSTFGREWMVVGIILAGAWAIHNALVRRRYTETTGALVKSVVFILVALFLVHQPERTIGAASEWTNDLSVAFLVAVDDTSGGGTTSAGDGEAQAKENVRKQLWQTFGHDPWRVLNFGGLEVCANEPEGGSVIGATEKQGQAQAVSCDGPHDARHDTDEYALRYLAFEPGSEARDAEFDALRDGEQSDNEGDFVVGGLSGDGEAPDYQPTDAVAVDVQQEGGGYQRLVYATILLLGSLGAVILLGFLSLAIVLAQVIALVFLAFAPVALVIGIFPGRGHDFFVSWVSKLATAVFIKAAYSLLLAIVLAVSAALLSATAGIGFLFAFGLQCLFLWAVFIYRKTLANAPLKALTSGEGSERETDRTGRGAARYAHEAVASPIHAFRRAGTRRAAYSGATAAGGVGAAGGATVTGQAKRSLHEREHGRRLEGDSERTLRRRERLLQARPERMRSNGDRRELGHLRESRPDKGSERTRRTEAATRRTRQAFTGRPYSRRELREEKLGIAEAVRAHSSDARAEPDGSARRAQAGGPQQPRAEQSSLERLEQETRQLEERRRERGAATGSPGPVERGSAGEATATRKRKLSKVPRKERRD